MYVAQYRQIHCEQWKLRMQLMKVYMVKTSCNQMLIGSVHNLFAYTVYGAYGRYI